MKRSRTENGPRCSNEWNTYPPLGHLIGAIGVAIGGYRTFAVILALNLVFVPLLAVSCYGVGRLIAGPLGGLLAVIFALGTPMIVSESHEAYLDPTQAAFVAAAVWGILASERFERWGIAALAGLATALALMTKETSPVFLAGILAVVLARGGWRHWRGLLAYIVVAGVVAGPWYFDHRTLVHELFLAHSATANSVEANPFGGPYPTLLSLKNVTWYFWDAANIQLRAGLLALFLSARSCDCSCVKTGERKNLYPELLGGAFVSWAGMTWLTHKDPRYDLSALIYVAVLAHSMDRRIRTAGAPLASRRARRERGGELCERGVRTRRRRLPAARCAARGARHDGARCPLRDALLDQWMAARRARAITMGTSSR